ARAHSGSDTPEHDSIRVECALELARRRQGSRLGAWRNPVCRSEPGREAVKHVALWSALSAVVMAVAPLAAQEQKPSEVRRVVTKIDASGKAVVMLDGAVPLKALRSPNPVGEMWVTDKSPPDFSSTEDRAAVKVGLVPPKNGTVFRIVDFVPIKPEHEHGDMNQMMKVVG